MRNKELILNPYFIGGLFILLLNDFYLKQEFGNFLTGKLSDFAGLLIFPMFIAALTPKLKKPAAFITAIGLILWKLPLMTPVIDLVNHATGLGICRVIGYHPKDTIPTDTIANIKYGLEAINPNKTRLTIINVTLPKEGNIQDWKILRNLNKEYKRWLKWHLIDEIKQKNKTLISSAAL